MEPRKEDQELLNLQEVAKSKKVGIWQAAGAKHVRNVKYHENKKESDPDQLFAFFEKNKNKSLNGTLGFFFFVVGDVMSTKNNHLVLSIQVANATFLISFSYCRASQNWIHLEGLRAIHC